MKKFRLKTDIDRDGKIDAASIHGLREDFFQKSAAVISQQQQHMRSFSKEYGGGHAGSGVILKNAKMYGEELGEAKQKFMTRVQSKPLLRRNE